MSDRRSDWARWLEQQMLDQGLTRIDLMDRIGRRPNGHYKVDASRLSNWLGQKSVQPSFRNVKLVASALGVQDDEALKAAGFDRDGMPIRQEPEPDPVDLRSMGDMTAEEHLQVMAYLAGLRAARSHR